MTLDPEFSSVYSLNSDSAGHLWMGILDPESPLYNKEYADKIWPYYEQVFVLQDEWLGDMREAAGPDAAFALVSDHGMEGVSARFNINRVLQDAGLLTLRTDGSVDLTKTKAMAPPWSYGSIVINTEEWANGRVPLEEKAAVKAQVREALLSATDSDGHLVTAVYDADELEQLGVSGPASGDLYYDIRKGLYESTRSYDSLTSAYSKPLGAGVHGGWSLRPKLQGICVMGGSGVAKIDSPKLVRAIDVAPTLAKLMGIPNPPQATGHIIAGAIQE
jgi:predicted AlkP superfamily phosphohydrolase/phosphomutase